jgi:hypothetical protein
MSVIGWFHACIDCICVCFFHFSMIYRPLIVEKEPASPFVIKVPNEDDNAILLKIEIQNNHPFPQVQFNSSVDYIQDKF